ncbi:MAG TPA: MOSC domain-containing protein [Myxococcota bacterium]|nr:MOSC domain-containing protein [Myxococcota bacterium]
MAYFGEKPLQDLVDKADQRGAVRAISLRPTRREAVVQVQQWPLGDRDKDHARAANRAVTLIAVEDLEAASRTLGEPVEHAATRRNVLVEGINLLTLIDREFRVGEVVLRATRTCDPCPNMEQTVGPGALAALVGRGGLCCAIVESGTIRVGDEVSLR